MSVGNAVGAAVGAVIGFYVGGPAGALKGAQLGMTIGGIVDPPKGPSINGPRLTDLTLQSSSYDAVIARTYGTASLTGNIIWLENNQLKEVATKKKSGGKGGGGGSSVTTYAYYGTFACALCKGPITGVRRIWIGPNLVYDAGSTDLKSIIASNQASSSFTIYTGTDTQLPDSRMQATLGIANTPAYRGLAYIVFKDLALKAYGNTLMGAQIKVEVVGAGTKVYMSYTARSAIQHPKYPSKYFNNSMKYVGGDSVVLTTYTTNSNWVYEEHTFSLAGVSQGVRSWSGTNSWEVNYGAVLNWPELIKHGYDAGNWVNLKNGFGSKVPLTANYSTLFASSPMFVKVSGYIVHVNNYIGRPTLHRFRVNGDYPSATLESFDLGVFTTVNYVSWYPDSSLSFLWVIVSGTTSGLSKAYLYKCDFNGGMTFVADITTPWGVSYRSNLQAFSMSNNRLYMHTGQIYDIQSGSAVYLGAWVAVGESSPLFGCPGIWFNARYTVSLSEKINSGPPALSYIVQTECVNSNLLSPTDIDVALLTQPVRGYRIGRISSLKTTLEPLQAAWPFDIIQSGYKLKFKPRGATSVVTIPEEDLAARQGE